MSDANEQMKQKIRASLGSQKQVDNAQHNAQAAREGVKRREARETRVMDALEESGYFDSWRDASTKQGIRRAAEARIDAEIRAEEQRDRDTRQSAIIAEHLKRASSYEAQLQELRAEVKQRGEVRAVDRIAFERLTQKARRAGEAVEPLEA